MAHGTPAPLVLNPLGGDLHGENARLRARGRLTRIELPDGVPAWSVTDHDLLKQLLTDSRVSKDSHQHWPLLQSGQVTPDWPLFTWIAVTNMFTAYGSDHRRLRHLISPALTARRMASLRPRIEAIVAELLDDLAEAGAASEVDLREMFAYPIPIRVISELLGLPEALSLRLRAAVDGIFNTALSADEAAENYRKTYEVLDELIDLRRRDPGDDMTSVLISTRDDADKGLTEAELRDTLLLVIAAGHETTVNLLDNAATALLRDPEQLDLVQRGQAGWGDVVEESLRLEAPLAHLPLRFAVEDIEVDGVTISQGEAILASYAAAGQDPAHYGPTALVFDVTRANKEHLAFGYGVHFCLGAPLGRLEAEVALPALFNRFPGITLAVPAEDLRPMVGFISNGHRSLPVNLTRPLDRELGHEEAREAAVRRC